MATQTSPQPPTLDLLIIGAGVYGICAANTYLTLHPQSNIKVLDSDNDVGGVWSRSRLYPNFWSQTGVRLAGFPDEEFKPPPEAEKYHDLVEAKYVTRYLEEYVGERVYEGRSLRERFVFGCWVRRLSKGEDGVWRVEADVNGETMGFWAKKVIVATGLSSLPNMPDLPGRGLFKGFIVHQKDFGRSRIFTPDEPDLDKHEHITVYGGSKSAADIAYAAATDTTRPRKVNWIIRTTGRGPLAFAAVKSPFSKYRNFPEIGTTRASGCLSSANLYLPENSWREWFLYHTVLGEWLLEQVFLKPQNEYMKDADFEGREGALPGFGGLRSKSNVRWRAGHIGLMQRDDFWDVIAKSVQVHRGDIVEVKEDAVVLESGEEVRTDVLLCGTGWLPQATPFLGVDEAERLGMPISLTDTEVAGRVNEYWAGLDEGADRKVLARWPSLAHTSRFQPIPIKTTPYRLYNMTLPLNDQSIAFLGIPLVPNSYHTALAQTLFAIAALDGTMKLPPREQMEKDVAFTNAWCRRRYPMHGHLGNVLEFEMVSFTDRLLEELGLESHRLGREERRTWRGWWKDLTEPCLGSDYGGLVDEYWGKYMDGLSDES